MLPTFQATVDKRVLTSFSFDDVLQVNSGQNGLKVIVWDAMRLHVFHCVWINHLIAQRANRHVGSKGEQSDTKDERGSTKFSRSSLTNRFYVAVRLFSNRSQMTSTGGKNKDVAHQPQASVLLYFDIIGDLLQNRLTVTWNLFVLYNEQKRKRPTCCAGWLFEDRASLGTFQVTNATFRLCFFVLS